MSMVLASPVPDVVDLGTSFEFSFSGVIEGAYGYFDYDGDHYAVIYYSNASNFQGVVVNLSTGDYYVSDNILGRPGTMHTCLHSSGKLYVQSNTKLAEIDFVGGTTSTRYTQTADTAFNYVVEGDDGLIYAGTWGTTCHVFMFDPANPGNGITDYGSMVSDQAIFNIGCDGSYIYIAIRGNVDNYLVVYQISNSSKNTYWTGEGKAIELHLQKGNDAYWYAWNRIREKFYRLDGFTQTEVDSSYWTNRVVNKNFGYETSYGNGEPPPTGWTISWEDAATVGDSPTADANIYWTPSGGSLQSVTTPVNATLCAVGSVYPKTSSEIWVGYSAGNNYPPPAICGASLTVPGTHLMSLYDMVKASNGKFYFFGYSNIFEEYDPAQSWTMNSANDSPSANPHKIGVPNGYKYHYWGNEGTDGLIYGVSVDAGALSGNTGDILVFWYDPDTEDIDSISLSLGGSGYVARNAVCIGNYILISTQKTGVDGKFHYFDTVTKTETDTWEPNVGVDNCGILCALDSTRVLGIVPGASDYLLYVGNISTKTVLYSQTNSGLAFGQTNLTPSNKRFKLIMGPDGYVWFYVDSNICRINPSTYAVDTVKASSPGSNLAFSGRNIYIGGNGQNIRKIADLFLRNYSMGSYINLPGTDADLSTPYTSDQITDVATDDTDMVAQLATSQIAIHQFKREIAGTGGLISVVAQVTIPCSTSKAQLQIYNRSGTPAWEDAPGANASDTTTGANTDFTLSSTVADLTDYKDENNIVACRVYQEMQ